MFSESAQRIRAWIFKYDPAMAKYLDWDLYEILDHNYTNYTRLEQKCYLHMKLVKNEWLGRQWANLGNLTAVRSVPEARTASLANKSFLRRAVLGFWPRAIRWLARVRTLF